jgi:exopolysaccharide biosynthesis polyprenyl glycosylphosphotransferase
MLDAIAAVDDRTIDILERRRRTDLRRRGWLVRRALLAADVLGLTLAFLVAATAYRSVTGVDHVALWHELWILCAALPFWVVLAKLYGLYDRDEERTDHSTVDDVTGVFHLVTVGAWLFYLARSATSVVDPPLARVVTFWLLAVLAITVFRAVARTAVRRNVAYLQNTIIVGAGEVGQLTARKLLNHPEYGINLVGFMDATPMDRVEGLEHVSVLGAPERLPDMIRLLDVERVIFAFTNETHEETLELIREIKDLDVQVDIVPRLFEIVGPNVTLHTVEGIPLFGMPRLRLSRSSRLLKRSLDLLLSVGGLIALAPVLAAVALWVKLDSRGPVFFRQVRRGAGEQTFRIFKFRTMCADAEARKREVAHLNMHLGDDPRMFKIPDDPRITKAGAFLRRTRLDELPQLLNVIKGEMSLVGPRPLILDEDQYVEGWSRKRLDLKPGITGVWQVLGASDIPFDEMTKLDYLYVTNWSLREDLRLIFLTLPSLLRKRLAY